MPEERRFRNGDIQVSIKFKIEDDVNSDRAAVVDSKFSQSTKESFLSVIEKSSDFFMKYKKKTRFAQITVGKVVDGEIVRFPEGCKELDVLLASSRISFIDPNDIYVIPDLVLELPELRREIFGRRRLKMPIYNPHKTKMRVKYPYNMSSWMHFSVDHSCTLGCPIIIDDSTEAIICARNSSDVYLIHGMKVRTVSCNIIDGRIRLLDKEISGFCQHHTGKIFPSMNPFIFNKYNLVSLNMFKFGLERDLEIYVKNVTRFMVERDSFSCKDCVKTVRNNFVYAAVTFYVPPWVMVKKFCPCFRKMYESGKLITIYGKDFDGHADKRIFMSRELMDKVFSSIDSWSSTQEECERVHDALVEVEEVHSI